MRNKARELAGRFWSHCTGPVTVRGILFIAVMILFVWALFDRLAIRDHNAALQRRLDLYTIETQQGLSQIYQSWAKFDAAQQSVLINQRAMQDEINAQTEILNTERSAREKDQKARAQSAGRPRPQAKPSRTCYRLEEQIQNFGSGGAAVKRQIFIPMPCP